LRLGEAVECGSDGRHIVMRHSISTILPPGMDYESPESESVGVCPRVESGAYDYVTRLM
jgi:hypothetical protein